MYVFVYDICVYGGCVMHYVWCAGAICMDGVCVCMSGVHVMYVFVCPVFV